MTHIIAPFCEGNGYVCDYAFRIGLLYSPIAYLDLNRFTAVQTWSVDLDRFSWK